MNKLTSFLYARPSLNEGFCRLIDFGNTLQIYNSALSSEQADFLAIASDWYVIGDDLREVMTRDEVKYLQGKDDILNEAKEFLLAELLED